MSQNLDFSPDSNIPINILLADDDMDDRNFFEMVLKSIQINTIFTKVEDGEKLMNHLEQNFNRLPDVLFLDFNMPRKNGLECLKNINFCEKFKNLPVIMYSTYLQEEIADELYDNGAYYYMHKTDLKELKIFLQHILTMMKEKRFVKPARDKFILSLAVV